MPPLAPQAAVHRSASQHSPINVRISTLGDEGGFYCADGSDQAHCEGQVFTGCLILTGLGVTISPCSECLCNLTGPVTKETVRLMPYAGERSSLSDLVLIIWAVYVREETPKIAI